MNTLLSRCEDAFVSILTPIAAAHNANIQPGKSSADKALPLVICSAEGQAEEDPKGSGNFWVAVQVIVKTRAVFQANAPAPGDEEPGPLELDPKTVSNLLVSDIFSALQQLDLPEQLSAITFPSDPRDPASDPARDFTVMPAGVLFDAPEHDQSEDGFWIDTLPIRVYCCASALDYA